MNAAKRELARSEARLRALVSALPDLTLILDDHGTYVDVLIGDSHKGLLFKAARDLRGKRLHDVMPKDKADEFMAVVRRTLDTNLPQTHEYVLEVQAGQRWFEGRTAPLASQRPDEPRTVVWVAHDITERRHAEILRTQLLDRVVTAQENERAKISRELHDALGQTLTAIGVQLSALENEALPNATQERVRKIRQLAEGAVGDIAAMARLLRPPVLDELGLVAAIEESLESFTAEYGIPARLHLVDTADNLQFRPAVGTAVYRIIQEALTNVLKHACARTVNVTVRGVPSGVEVTVADDGVGMGQADDGPMQRGLGIPGMRERARLLHGTLRAEKNPGGGTLIVLSIPL